MSLQVLFHKVGAGHAVHVFTPNGKLVVIDLGASSDFSPLRWLRTERGVSTIDLLVISHPHGDHIEEILLLRSLLFTVHQLSRPQWLTATEVQCANQAKYATHVGRYLEMSSSFNRVLSPSESLTSSSDALGGVQLRVYDSLECGRSNINNHSLVVVLKYAGSTIVVPGDNESASWGSLLKDPSFVSDLSNADIFLTSHHGRESGYCAELFANGRKPRLFVTSDGCSRDTDATAYYSQHALGWAVHKRSGGIDAGRKVVTTRTDGFIDARFGYMATTAQPFMEVRVA